MNHDLNKLYSEIIKAHNDSPYHFEKGDVIAFKAYNPICGDRFDVYLDSDQQKVRGVRFQGFGCAISKASTSIMAKTMEGKSLKEARELCDQFLRFVNKETVNEVNLPDEFLAFRGVHDFPERMECATLSWVEMKKCLGV